MTRPSSNLPHSGRWVTSVETDLDKVLRDNETLVRDNETLRQQLEVLGEHTSQLQNYVRAICVLGGYGYPPADSPDSIPGTPPKPPTPSPETPTAPTRSTVTLSATWSCSWGSGGFKYTTPGNGDTDSRSLYQRGSGGKIGMFGFDTSVIRGKKVLSAELYLNNISTYYNRGFTAILGTHNNGSAPAGKPGGRANGFDVGWGSREGKWITLDSWNLPALSSGEITGYTLGDGATGTGNYARFAGLGQPNPPQLRIVYEA